MLFWPYLHPHRKAVLLGFGVDVFEDGVNVGDAEADF